MQLRRGLDAEEAVRQARGAALNAAITVVSKITAARNLIPLAGWEMLQKVGEGRSTRYYPNLPGWMEG